MENKKQKNVLSSHDENLLQKLNFVNTLESFTALWLSYKIEEKWNTWSRDKHRVDF